MNNMLDPSAHPLVVFKPIVPDNSLSASLLQLSDKVFQLNYNLETTHSSIRWPPFSTPPRRRDELWKSTCFELFAGASNQKAYHEINLSPSGDWNSYSFSDLRQGMKPLDHITVAIRSAAAAGMTPAESSCFTLSAEVSSPRLVDLVFNQNARVGLAAILDWKEKGLEYWALRHSNEKPNFHCREDWIWRPEVL
ncbi:MAG: hypothetical protein C5B49_03920 [Bdellovibrio sp.]|nr:MAG: hypothetical protein C5B49_03920 [Bdellovibrio sp.]